jgi:hypothetical protein
LSIQKKYLILGQPPRHSCRKDSGKVKGKTKPDLIIFDSPDYKGQSNNDDPDGISGLSKEKYLLFYKELFFP